MIHTMEFYCVPGGHPTTDLHTLVGHARKRGEKIVFLCGDQSVDTKLPVKVGVARPVDILSDDGLWADTPTQQSGVMWPQRSFKDVAYFVNMLLPCHNVAINCAAAGRGLKQRLRELLPQEKLVRDHICAEDALVVAIGAEKLTEYLHARRWLLRTCPQKWVVTYFGRDVRRMAERHAQLFEHYVGALTLFARPRVLMIADPVYLRSPNGPGHERKIRALMDVFSREVAQRVYVGSMCETSVFVRASPYGPNDPTTSEGTALNILRTLDFIRNRHGL